MFFLIVLAGLGCLAFMSGLKNGLDVTLEEASLRKEEEAVVSQMPQRSKGPGRVLQDRSDERKKETVQEEVAKVQTTDIRKTGTTLVVRKVSHERLLARMEAMGHSRSFRKRFPGHAKSLFSFASLRPGSKRDPVLYGTNLMKLRLAAELGQGKDISGVNAPRSIVPAVYEPFRAEIPLELSPGHKLGDRLPASSTRNVLVATSWRSGSTFMGDLLDHYPGAFYSFEPLHFLSHWYRSDNNTINGTKYAADAVQLLSGIFKCDFTTKLSNRYLSHVAKGSNQFLLKHNFRLWNVCETLLPAASGCFLPALQSRICSLFPLRVVKTVRLRVSLTEKLLKDTDINIKVVVLVRDPRGVMKSRSAMSWCEQPQCANTDVVCKDLKDDYQAAVNLRKKFPGRIHLLRYEDLSTNPYETTDRLLDFLELSRKPVIEEYLLTHTKTKRYEEEEARSSQNNASGLGGRKRRPSAKDNPYSTLRNSKATAFKWRQTMDMSFMQRIQAVCAEPMNDLGYNLIHSPEERDDTEFPVIGKNPQEIWPP